MGEWVTIPDGHIYVTNNWMSFTPAVSTRASLLSQYLSRCHAIIIIIMHIVGVQVEDVSVTTLVTDH